MSCPFALRTAATIIFVFMFICVEVDDFLVEGVVSTRALFLISAVKALFVSFLQMFSLTADCHPAFLLFCTSLQIFLSSFCLVLVSLYGRHVGWGREGYSWRT